jgi:hypothetical protein
MKVFLGGTCGKLDWRKYLISKLNIDYFNPVIDDWTQECIVEENKQKEICDYNLFVITCEMKGVYSIAEVVDLSNKKPTRTILCILENGFSDGEIRSLNAVYDLVKKNGSVVFKSLDDVAYFLTV